MEKQVIIVGSITYAMKGKEILSKNGVKTNIEKISRRNRNTGCGYALVIYGDLSTAVKILMQNGIRALDENGEVFLL